MSKIDLIIDALLVAESSVWSEKIAEALAAARELREVNAELLEALKEAEDYLRHAANSPDMADKVKAAIAKAEVTK